MNADDTRKYTFVRSRKPSTAKIHVIAPRRPGFASWVVWLCCGRSLGPSGAGPGERPRASSTWEALGDASMVCARCFEKSGICVPEAARTAPMRQPWHDLNRRVTSSEMFALVSAIDWGGPARQHCEQTRLKPKLEQAIAYRRLLDQSRALAPVDAEQREELRDGHAERATKSQNGDLSLVGGAVGGVLADAEQLAGLGDADGGAAVEVGDVHAGSITQPGLVEEVRVLATLPTPADARLIREDAGVSQSRMAEAIGVHRLTLARWETGAVSPRFDVRVRWAKVLAELAELAQGDDR